MRLIISSALALIFGLVVSEVAFASSEHPKELATKTASRAISPITWMSKVTTPTAPTTTTPQPEPPAPISSDVGAQPPAPNGNGSVTFNLSGSYSRLAGSVVLRSGGAVVAEGRLGQSIAAPVGVQLSAEVSLENLSQPVHVFQVRLSREGEHLDESATIETGLLGIRATDANDRRVSAIFTFVKEGQTTTFFTQRSWTDLLEVPANQPLRWSTRVNTRTANGAITLAPGSTRWITITI